MKYIKLFEEYDPISELTDDEFDDLSTDGFNKIDIHNEYGYVIGWYYDDEDEVELKIIHIYKQFRGLGYAKKLMYEFIEECKKVAYKIILEVESVEEDGLTDDELYLFYEKFGFKKTHSNYMELVLF